MLTPVPRIRRAASAGLALVTVLLAGGCAKMDATLGQQWIVVQFKPGTTLATARHVTAACSHVPNLTLQPVRPTSAAAGLVDSAQFNATQATDAQLALLQQCLQRFPAVQGFTMTDTGAS